MIRRTWVCKQLPLPLKNCTLPSALFIGLLVCISRLLTLMGVFCQLYDHSILSCVCVVFFLSFEGIYVRALLLSTLKVPSSLAAGKSFLLAMPLTRCPICAKFLLSLVHANKKSNVGACTESKKGSFLVVKENSCLLSIYQVKTNGWIMISKWKLPFVSN